MKVEKNDPSAEGWLTLKGQTQDKVGQIAAEGELLRTNG